MRQDGSRWVVTALGVMLTGSGVVSADYPSVGKAPYTALASIAGSADILGKPPTVVLSEGPPPRRHVALQTILASDRFFYLYADLNSPLNHFQPIGYMGDYQDVHINLNSIEDPADGLTCIQIHYAPSIDSGRGWAGIYWLDPKSNWGDRPAAYNLSHMSRLTFWARGSKGGEKIAVFRVGGVNGRYSDTGTASIGPIWLTNDWQQYVIDLQNVDLSKVNGGFAWSVSASDNVGPLTFYIDEIRYER